MGKNKNKGFKMAKKKVAPEKFLVVVNPWGLSPRGDFDTSDFNNVGAWFEFMLRDDHPGVGIQAMYYQRTHRNIIVELPREVKDITNYIGRHYYSQFLTHSPHSQNYADIYEYKYSLHGDPGEKNWSIGYPTYKEIPKGIPLANPYPCPGTSGAPPIDVADYAYPIPPSIYEGRLERLASELQMRASAAESSLLSSSSKNEALSSSRPDKNKGETVETQSLLISPKSSFTPYSPSTHPTIKLKGSMANRTEGSSSIVKKIDPYEEDELATQSLSLAPAEIKDEAEDFLSSLIGQPNNQEEEMGPIASEVDEDDYEPSTELLALFDTLPPELNSGGVPQQEDLDDNFDIKIKPEPIDELMPEYQPSEGLFYPESEKPAPFEVKPEPAGFSIRSPLVKAEPVDDDGVMDFQSRDYRQGASRDPRNRRRERSNGAENKRRPSPTLYGLSKRVKIEDDQ